MRAYFRAYGQGRCPESSQQRWRGHRRSRKENSGKNSFVSKDQEVLARTPTTSCRGQVLMNHEANFRRRQWRTLAAIERKCPAIAHTVYAPGRALHVGVERRSQCNCAKGCSSQSKVVCARTYKWIGSGNNLGIRVSVSNWLREISIVIPNEAAASRAAVNSSKAVIVVPQIILDDKPTLQVSGRRGLLHENAAGHGIVRADTAVYVDHRIVIKLDGSIKHNVEHLKCCAYSARDSIVGETVFLLQNVSINVPLVVDVTGRPATTAWSGNVRRSRDVSKPVVPEGAVLALIAHCSLTVLDST